MNQSRNYGVLSLPVIVGALGYFVDIYDLLLFSIVRIESLSDLGLNEILVRDEGMEIIEKIVKEL